MSVAFPERCNYSNVVLGCPVKPYEISSKIPIKRSFSALWSVFPVVAVSGNIKLIYLAKKLQANKP